VLRLLAAAGVPPEPKFRSSEAAGAWLRPLTLATLRGSLGRRALAALLDGRCALATSRAWSLCVRVTRKAARAARGAGLGLEMDSSAGYGGWVRHSRAFASNAGNHATNPGSVSTGRT